MDDLRYLTPRELERYEARSEMLDEFYLLLGDIFAENDYFKGLDRAADLLEKYEEEYGKNANRGS